MVQPQLREHPEAPRPAVVRIPLRLSRRLRKLAVAGHPHEVCGLLVGTVDGRASVVTRITEARNLAVERLSDRYTLDPTDFLRADAEARRDGLEILGVWHTHPDHPARPSATDLEAAWEGYTYLILSVRRGGVVDARAWTLETGSFVEQRFEEVPMSQATIRIPTPLRSYTGGAGEVEVSGSSVREALDDLERRHPGILERVLDGRGEVRGFVNLYVGERNVKALGGLDAPLPPGAVVAIVPAVAGGLGGARDRRLGELRSRIDEVTPEQALVLQQQGAVLIDVREPEEVAQGSPRGATRIVRGFLELNVEQSVPDLETHLLTICAGGARSLLAADNLQQLGYRKVASVAGGFTAWKSGGLPVEIPRTLDGAERERYMRHLAIPEVGEQGQIKLLDSKVLLVGAGGLGCPAAFYLAAAGVGTLGIVDDDVVDRTNLQRQILHTEERVGRPKVESARRTLEALSPGVRVVEHAERLVAANVEQTLSGYDLVVDGADNFATRYLINDACVKLGLPNVHGSVYRFEGQVSVFWPGRAQAPGPCYRCLYPAPPPPEMAPSCAEAGVLGVLPGVIGLLQAVEAIKVLLGIGDPLVGSLVQYDALETRFTKLQLDRDPGCRYCADGAEFPGYVDMAEACGV